MKILILGGDGMLGHQLLLHLQTHHQVWVTLHQQENTYEQWAMFNHSNSYFGIDIFHLNKLFDVIDNCRPDVVINAVGLVKQRNNAKDLLSNLEVNALFPHHLAQICRQFKARMIHISTDCVFSGVKGNYLEEDFCDAVDFYGKTKYLGEVKESHCVTIRTSMIGLELSRKTSLIEWFLSQTGSIEGYTRAIYTGFTTQELSRIIERVLVQHPSLFGVWQIASQPIDKYTLLVKLANLLKRRDIYINANENFICDRSLNGTRFCAETGYKPPSWEDMLTELSEQIFLRKKEVISCNA